MFFQGDPQLILAAIKLLFLNVVTNAAELLPLLWRKEMACGV